MGGGEHRPGRRDDRTGGYIFPPEHYVLQRFYGSIELYGLFAAVGQFLHQNAVRALRQRGAGHDAGSAPCGQRRSRGIARVKLHHHRQGDRGLPACTGGIRAVQGVAVQRAAVKGGLVHPGAEVPGSNTPAGGFQRDGLRGRRRQKRCRVQHAAQRLDGGAERLVHYNFLHRPAALPFCYGSDGAPAGVFFFQKRQVKKSGDVLTGKSKRLRRISPQNRLRQFAVCYAGGSLWLCAALAAAAHSQKAPVKMGGVLFFKLQRFFCGKAVGFPPPPLNARPCGCSIAARCPALCGSLDAFAQRSSYTLIQL